MLPDLHVLDRGIERRAGRRRSAAATRRRSSPIGDGDRGVGVPALDDRAAVEREDVARPRARCRPGCRARSRRSATCRSPRGSRGSSGSSSGRRGRSRTSRATGRSRAVVTPGFAAARAALVHLGDDPAGRRIERDLVRLLAGDHRSVHRPGASGDSPSRRSRRAAAGTPRPRRRPRRPRTSSAPLPVEVDERLGLLVVELQAAADRLLGVVLAAPAEQPLDRPRRWGRRGRSRGRAGARAEDPVELLRPGCAVRGKPSSTKPCSTSAGFEKRSSTTSDHDVVGDELAAVHVLLGLEPGRRPRPSAESRNSWPVERCWMPKCSARRSPWVPLPAPCLPRMTRRGPRVTSRHRQASGEEALVVPHHELAVDLLHGLERDAHGDQQRGAAERELRDVPHLNTSSGVERDRSEEERRPAA